MDGKQEILWDFDGVVGNTYTLNWSLVRLLHPEVSEHGYRFDHHLGNVFEAPVVPFTADSTAAYYRYYEDLLTIEHLADGIPSLRALACTARFHIVSSNYEPAIERVLKDAGLLPYFGGILGCNAHASKVEKFKRLASEYDFALDRALFVTDTLGDLKEAQKAGVPAIGVTFGYHSREYLERGVSIAVVDSWDELVAVVERYKT